MDKRKEEEHTFLREKEKKNQSSVTMTIYVDEKGTVFPVNGLNKNTGCDTFGIYLVNTGCVKGPISLGIL